MNDIISWNGLRGVQVMKNVLFVCLGNIARSTMAEALFTQMVAEEGLTDQIKIDSAGTSNEEMGNPPHPGTQKILKEHQIPFDWIRARQIRPEDFEWADYIITMDQQNMRNLKRLAPSDDASAKIKLAYSILPSQADKEIQDPWYTRRFDVTYRELKETLPAWLVQIKADLKNI